MNRPPLSMVWGFTPYSLTKKKYLKELDFIKNHTSVTHLIISPREGVHLQNLQQCHPVLEELVAYAHQIGLKVSLHLVTAEGFYNAAFITDNSAAADQVEVFPIPERNHAQGLTRDIELVADEEGFAIFTHTALWGRSKLMPTYANVLCAYAFDKTADGFYAKGSLVDITDRVRITDARTHSTTFEIDLGKENAGKHLFVLLSQYYNFTAIPDDWEKIKSLMDSYADIPFDGVCMDEYGYMPLNHRNIKHGIEPPFRGRFYSESMDTYYRETLDTDLARLLFDMRYAPEGEEELRIQAINTYFETLRVFPLSVEKNAYDYAKKTFGEDAYIACHNTFHNKLDNDEIWHTACNWWDIPRDYAHTDENICFPVRWGLMLACKNPITFDMYYSKNAESHYTHIIEGAPFNCREIHHSFDDFYWGQSFNDLDFLKNIKTLDDSVAELDRFQTVYPKMDLLVIFGAAAQNNWYPNEDARNVFDIDGTLQILPKCAELWNLGYRLALAPDYAIEDGRITEQNGKISFGGKEFSHVLFLYPKYAKKETYEFLNQAHHNGVALTVVGASGIDFDGNPVTLTAPHTEEYSPSILEAMGTPKSAIDGGCVLEDGSFSLVSEELMDPSAATGTEFCFTVDGNTYSGRHTGLLAYRANEMAFATEGSTLFVNGREISLDTI